MSQNTKEPINNYFCLSDNRYLELKHGQEVIVKWVTQIAEKTGLTIDTKELDWHQ